MKIRELLWKTKKEPAPAAMSVRPRIIASQKSFFCVYAKKNLCTLE